MKRGNCKYGCMFQKGGSFGKAFAEARKAGLKVFEWNGKSYNTLYREELEAQQGKRPTPQKQVSKPAPVQKSVQQKPAPVDTSQFSTSTIGFKASDAGVSTQTTSRAVQSPTPPPTPAKKQVAKPQPKKASPTKLESGVVVDKGQNMQYLIQNGKVVKSFPVLTGEAGNVDVNPYSVQELAKDPKLRGTPLGDFFMRPSPDIYGKPGMDLLPIADKQGNVPVNYATAIHNRYNPAVRDKFFNMSPEKRRVSYGCTNLRGEDIDCTTQMFPQGDTATFVDTRTPRGREVMQQYRGRGGNITAQNGRYMIDPKLFRPKEEEVIPGVNIPFYEDEKYEEPQYRDRIQEGIAKGIIEAPRADSPDEQMTAQQYYDAVNAPKKTPATPKNWKQNLGIGLMAIRTLGSEISGRVARSRQNQYDYWQQPMLGWMNAMAPDQPNGANYYSQMGGTNPYSMYARYGGSLKKYQTGGPKPIDPTNPLQGYNNSMAVSAANQPKPSYNFHPVYNSGLRPSTDSLLYEGYFNNILNENPSSLKVHSQFQKYGIPPGLSENAAAGAWNQMNAYEDALSQKYKGAAKALSVTPEVSVNPNREQGGMSGYLKYGGLKHHNYFGPPFSNGVKMDMGDRDRFDKVLVNRRLVPELFLRRTFINPARYFGRKKHGGIHIKPENKGKFTEYCGGKVTGECIEQGLNSPSATIRKRANFARNARKWNK